MNRTIHLKRVNTPEEIISFLSEVNPEAALLDGFENALIGVITTFGNSAVALYDKNKIISTLAKDMPYEEAIEYFDFNIGGAYVENCPAFSEMEEETIEVNSKQIVRKKKKQKFTRLSNPKVNGSIMDLEP